MKKRSKVIPFQVVHKQSQEKMDEKRADHEFREKVRETIRRQILTSWAVDDPNLDVPDDIRKAAEKRRKQNEKTKQTIEWKKLMKEKNRLKENLCVDCKVQSSIIPRKKQNPSP